MKLKLKEILENKELFSKTIISLFLLSIGITLIIWGVNGLISEKLESSSDNYEGKNYSFSLTDPKIGGNGIVFIEPSQINPTGKEFVYLVKGKPSFIFHYENNTLVLLDKELNVVNKR